MDAHRHVSDVNVSSRECHLIHLLGALRMEEGTLPAAIGADRLSNRNRYHATRLKGRQFLENDPTVKSGLDRLEIPLDVRQGREKAAN